ncbi:peptidoglycan-binding protein [Leptolyngbya sp. AN02str]|uniref:peptidoglycan-binding protein n=1 Tax=Leptolyngbya sp. AN02str TaxID=3423363 RepID=UPI003D3185A1
MPRHSVLFAIAIAACWELGLNAVFGQAQARSPLPPLAQTAPAPSPSSSLDLGSGDQSDRVAELQQMLLDLGYYKGNLDGRYGRRTEEAVLQFQLAEGLPPDGEVTSETWFRLIHAHRALPPSATLPRPSVSPTPTVDLPELYASPAATAIAMPPQSPTPNRSLIWLSIGLFSLSALSGLLYRQQLRSLWNRPEKPSRRLFLTTSQDMVEPPHALGAVLTQAKVLPPPAFASEFDASADSDTFHSPPLPTIHNPTSALPHGAAAHDQANAQVIEAIAPTSRLPKVDVVNELIRQLQDSDPAQRYSAIWELGQIGDSRAVQPLVELLMDSDSHQHSLILAAISEINVRSLAPMKRALIASLQDANPDVRKNAIRDVTRVYELMGQVSQLLSHAVDDPDSDVQETARWAMGQLDRLRPSRDASSLAQPPSGDFTNS